MKLNNLQTLRELQSVGSVPTIKQLTYKRVTINKSFMNEIDLISYASSLLLFSARILRYEINVPNRERTLNATMQEVSKLKRLLSKDDYCLHNERTHKDTKKFFKEIGLKPRHIDTDRIRRELLKTI